MNYLQLVLTFLTIGALSFGGGFAMIPFFEKAIMLHHWTAAGDYTRVIAIAQVFPGPFAVDSSAYIGYRVGGIFGAVLATVSLCLPSFIALVLITKYYVEFKANRYLQMLLGGVRPVVIGLLFSAAYIIGVQPIIKNWQSLVLGIKVLLLITAGFWLQKATKINPVFFIIIFGVVGMVLF